MVMSLWPHFLAHLELLSVGLELGRGPVMHRSLSRIRQVAPMSTPSTAWFLGRTTVSPDRLSRFAGSTSVPNKTVPLSDLTNPPQKNAFLIFLITQSKINRLE